MQMSAFGGKADMTFCSMRPLAEKRKNAVVPIAATNTWVLERSFNVGCCTRRSAIRWGLLNAKVRRLPARLRAGPRLSLFYKSLKLEDTKGN